MIPPISKIGTSFIGSIGTFLLNRLDTPSAHYEQIIINNMESLYDTIQPGDVLLAEGRSKLSGIVNFLTQSRWSHAALYVGRDSSLQRPKDIGVADKHSIDRQHMLVEALPGIGVRAVVLKTYQYHNIRICRPFGISSLDLEKVITEVCANIGKRYDHQNILDLALMALPRFLNPFRKRTIKACLGGCTEYQVICSGMIAKAFQNAGYPIVPVLHETSGEPPPGQNNPYGSRLVMRHYSQITPGDFDISPNFEIIKYNIIGMGEFHYKSIWADMEVQ